MIDLMRRSPDRPAAAYDAFISYSHLEDDALAATLQAGLETFGGPWHRSRVSRVFRDMTDLAASPGLLSEITDALEISRWFVLIASERAAKSHWVNEEVSWWLANKGHERFLIALSDGKIHWRGQDFDWETTTALPPAVARAFTEEPGWIDLREIKEGLAESVTASDGRLRRLARFRARRQVGEWVAGLAAPIRGVSKGSLVGEHLRHRKRTRRLIQIVLATMLVLSTAALAAAAIAANQLAAARLQNRIATSRELAALSETLLTRHLDLAELFAVEAYRLNPSGQALAALFQAVTAGPHLVRYLAAGGTVSAVAGSADGRVVVAGRSDGTVLRWSLPDVRPAVIARMPGEVTGVSVNENGTAVAALSQGAVLRWDPDHGVRPLPTRPRQVPIGVSISASGRFAAVASAPLRPVPSPYFKLMIFGPDARIVKAADIVSITTSPELLTFSGDTQLVALGSAYGAWQRFSVPGLRSLGGYPGSFGNGAGVLSPGGGFIAASQGPRTVPVWDIRKQSATDSDNSLNIPTRGGAPSALAINLQGTLVAQASGGSIYVSGIPQSRASSASLTLAGNSVINDGGLAFAGRRKLISASGSLLALWDLRQYSHIATEASIPAPAGCAACEGPAVAVQPSGVRVAVVTGSNSDVAEQGLSPGAKPVVGSPALDAYGAPLWTPDGRHLLVPTDGGGAQVWSAARGFASSGRWRFTLPVLSVAGDDSPGLPIAMIPRPGGRKVIEVFPNGAAMVRDAATGRIDESVPGPPSLADGNAVSSSAAVNPAGKTVAVVTPHGVVVTSMSTKRWRTIPGNSGDKVAFDGEQLLIQQPDGPLQIWDADTPRLVKAIAGTVGTIAGPVTGRDGLIAETSSDGSAAVIDLKSGVTLGSFRPPAGTYFYSTGIGMTADGASLVTVTEAANGDKGTLTDWRMSVGTWLKVACATAGHALSDADWQEYVGGSPPGQLACGPGSA